MKMAHDDLDQESRIRDEESRKTVAWLSPQNFWAMQNDFFSRRQAQTGEWLLHDPTFEDWLDKGNRLLWCHGIRISPFISFGLSG